MPGESAATVGLPRRPAAARLHRAGDSPIGVGLPALELPPMPRVDSAPVPASEPANGTLSGPSYSPSAPRRPQPQPVPTAPLIPAQSTSTSPPSSRSPQENNVGEGQKESLNQPSSNFDDLSDSEDEDIEDLGEVRLGLKLLSYVTLCCPNHACS